MREDDPHIIVPAGGIRCYGCGGGTYYPRSECTCLFIGWTSNGQKMYYVRGCVIHDPDLDIPSEPAWHRREENE